MEQAQVKALGAKANELRRAGHLDNEEVLIVRRWTGEHDYADIDQILNGVAESASYRFGQNDGVRPYIPQPR